MTFKNYNKREKKTKQNKKRIIFFYLKILIKYFTFEIDDLKFSFS